MADETPEAGAAAAPEAAAQQTPPQLKIRTQYVKDVSFENIAAQKGFTPTTPPQIKVGVNLDAKKNGDNLYEVILTLKVNAEAADQPVFLMELDYAGTFEIENVPDAQMHPFLMIECPRMLFPFARRIVSDMTRDGGYPPVNIDPIDFIALYRNEILRRQQAQAAAAPSGTA
ncbi:protein-export chaperone SecB [Pontivivens insulae]|uniref:Protein-export protein SecB n=1 Tax=Pontivivens insulae TaxID=1639689 RepID=A0A2R8A883_9RHOB|nr:protein-export chaperone SecB [Pontivivens insulae]RED18330.1 protein translocase subunit secB [Pontivivens insulae]SPF28228.1 Protein-export protein SecB [Pontivivens insulae]